MSSTIRRQPHAADALVDKTVIVTGAGSGIGKTVAQVAASAGATVIVTDIKGHEATAEAIAAAGGSAQARELDVTSSSAWKSLVEAVIGDRGSVDGLVNVAGIVLNPDSLLTQDERGWDRVMDVDLKGPFLGMQAVVPHMLEAGFGRIVNVSAVAGVLGMPHVVSYAAAKGGVNALTRQVAVEFADRGIRVNAIAPGVIDTPILQTVTPELIAEAKKGAPTGELGIPEDIGDMAVYLLGPAGNFITGQTLVIDGGWTVA
ncbi:SDR family NAD(P)-dependent oxidoreductase [Gordonia sp. NPDC127522]|uniref:SDR family NAD(P)-dependent oxidoreductase n=1 Tax=Gordonia sp. NPDC127522 TaxID=3345390 RepID=UPI003643CEA3